MEHTVQPQPGSHVNKLWKRTMVDRDPEPLYSPLKIAARSSTPMFVLHNNQVKYDLRLILTLFFFHCLPEMKTAPISLATLLVPVPKYFFLNGRNNCYILALISKLCRRFLRKTKTQCTNTLRVWWHVHESESSTPNLLKSPSCQRSSTLRRHPPQRRRNLLKTSQKYILELYTIILKKVDNQTV